jgi:hypothetical protein
MRPLTHRSATVLVALFAFSGAAFADGGRARTMGLVDAAPARSPAANVSTTIQEGRGNAAGIGQTGSGNTAGILQFGRSNTGVVVQTGSGNNACLVQSGRNLDGAIVQTGDNLTTGVLQTRWGSNEIPVEVCSTATTRQEVMYYAERPVAGPRARAQERLALRGAR